MTEEIIVDGVDVAKCCYYESKNDTGKWCDLTCTRDNAPVFRCEKMPNCHYKQLKRLEQENKDLKTIIKRCNKPKINVIDADIALENAKLKKELEGAENNLAELMKENKLMKIQNEELYGDLAVTNRKLIDYKSALEEILECAKFAQCLPCGSGILEDCLNCNDDTTNNGQFCMEKRINEIITICNEVLNESK